MTLVIGKAVNFMAWGKTWKKFFDLCLELQQDPESTFKMKRPSRFSETKFADYLMMSMTSLETTSNHSPFY